MLQYGWASKSLYHVKEVHAKYYILYDELIYDLQKDKLIQIKSRLVFVGAENRLTIQKARGSKEGDGNVLILDCGNGCTTQWISWIIEIHT